MNFLDLEISSLSTDLFTVEAFSIIQFFMGNLTIFHLFYELLLLIIYELISSIRLNDYIIPIYINLHYIYNYHLIKSLFSNLTI